MVTLIRRQLAHLWYRLRPTSTRLRYASYEVLVDPTGTHAPGDTVPAGDPPVEPHAGEPPGPPCWGWRLTEADILHGHPTHLIPGEGAVWLGNFIGDTDDWRIYAVPIRGTGPGLPGRWEWVHD